MTRPLLLLLLFTLLAVNASLDPTTNQPLAGSSPKEPDPASRTTSGTSPEPTEDGPNQAITDASTDPGSNQTADPGPSHTADPGSNHTADPVLYLFSSTDTTDGRPLIDWANSTEANATEPEMSSENRAGYGTTPTLDGYGTVSTLDGYGTTPTLGGYGTASALDGYGTTPTLAVTEVDEPLFTKKVEKGLEGEQLPTTNKYAAAIIQKCVSRPELECYMGDGCRSMNLNGQKFVHKGIVQVWLTPDALHPPLSHCDVVAVVQKSTTLKYHYNLEYHTTYADQALSLTINSATFTLNNGRLACAPSCTLSAAKPLEELVPPIYYFNTNYFRSGTKKRAQLKTCLVQNDSKCYIGKHCTAGLQGEGNQMRSLPAKLKQKIIGDPDLRNKSRYCDVGAIVGKVDEQGRASLVYHTTADNGTPLVVSIDGYLHHIWVDDNDNLKCEQKRYCKIVTLYTNSYTDKNNNVSSLFYEAEIWSTARAQFGAVTRKPGAATGESDSDAQSQEGDEDGSTKDEKKTNLGTIVLCVLSGLVVSIVLAIVAVTMYRRYQNAKIKYHKAVITARANPEVFEVVPLLPSSASDPQSEKSAKGD